MQTASEIWTNSYGSICTTFWAFLTKRWRHFGRRFCSWNNYFILNYEFEDYHLSVFQKLRSSETCNQVASNIADPGSLKEPARCFRGVIWVFCLFLFPPCLRENVIVTCKIRSFLCSVDILLQKNVIVFFFGNSNFKMALIWKTGYFWPAFYIFNSPGKSDKTSFSTYLTHIHTFFFFCSPYWLFSPGGDSYFHDFEKKKSINNKMLSKTSVGMSTTDMYLHYRQIYSHL